MRARKPSWLVIVFLALVGCDSETETQPASQADTPAAAQESQSDAPLDDGATTSAPAASRALVRFRDVLPDGSPRPFGPFADVKLMETGLDEIAPALTELVGSEVDGLPGRYSAHSVKGRYEQWPDRVNELVIGFPDKVDPLPALKDAWGEPVRAPDNSGIKVDGERFDGRYWFNPQERVRARLTKRRSTTLVLSPYFPFDRLMGNPGSSRFGFEARQPLLGSTIEELESAYGRHLDKRMKSLWFPGREFDTFLTQVLYRLDDEDRVESFRFELQYEVGSVGGNPRQAVLDAFEDKFGDPRPGDGDDVLVYSSAPPVRLMDRPDRHRWRVWVGQR